MIQDSRQTLFDKMDYSKFLNQRILRLYDQIKLNYSKESLDFNHFFLEPIYLFV